MGTKLEVRVKARAGFFRKSREAVREVALPEGMAVHGFEVAADPDDGDLVVLVRFIRLANVAAGPLEPDSSRALRFPGISLNRVESITAGPVAGAGSGTAPPPAAPRPDLPGSGGS